MTDINIDNFRSSISALEHALSFEQKIANDSFYFAGISKSFEVCFEYAWKYFRRLGLDQGIDVYGPKDAIKIGGRIGAIDDVEEWLTFLADRNLAVHNYAGVEPVDYLKTIKNFLAAVKRVEIK